MRKNEYEAFLHDGREVMFEIYRKKECVSPGEKEYELLGEFADMSEVLESTVIQGRPFKEVIIECPFFGNFTT